ncbi:MAG: LysM peptidoglycan-binding domain-containing protein [Clostridiales bacterium]|nr:LysM peptidoglycan-binding domain-containing protein [Clostridiales bacterium]
MFSTQNNPTSCPSGTMPYIIQAGDTFFNLAIRFNTTVEAIMAANPGVDPNRLMIGQRICIPTGQGPSTCPPGTTPYTVRAGDTFFNIARANNISLAALIAANPGVDPDRLFIGQIICIPGGTTPPPTNPCPTLRMGSRGQDVIRLQRLLRDAGFNPGPIDGIFGSQTHRAVVEFQRSQHLVPDGVVGIRTWTALGVDCNRPPGGCPPGTFAYTIRPGDTLFQLARRFNTTVDAIMRVNPNINPNNLQIGQIICIPN